MRSRGSLLRVVLALAAASCGDNHLEDDGHVLYGAVPTMTAECGAAQKFFPLSIENARSADLEITGVLPTDGFSAIDPFPVVIGAGETGSITLRPPPTVVGVDVGGTVKTGSITLVTSVGNQRLAVSATVVGANLEITDLLGSPLAVTFSGAGCPAPITAMVKNTGNKGVVFTAPTSSAFRITGFTTGTLAGNASATFTVEPTTTSACTASESLSFTATGAVCSTMPIVIPASFSLTGTPDCSCP